MSLVVPVYNSAPTLERCLSAVCAQLGASDELIVVEDGSTDDARPRAFQRFIYRRVGA